MFNGFPVSWNLRIRRALVVALVAPLLSILPSAPIAVAGVTSMTAPQGITVTTSPGVLVVEWSAPATGAGSVTGYRVDYSTDGSTWTTASSAISSAATSYTINGLTAGTSYYVRMAALFSPSGTGPFGYPWTPLYATTTQTRNGNAIAYSPNLGLATEAGTQASKTLASASFTRVRYRMQYEDSGLKYVNTDFSKWGQKTLNQYTTTGTYTTPAASIGNLSIPSLDNQFIIQTDVSDLTVESNITSLNDTQLSGRLEIWPFDYHPSLNTTLTGGSADNFDANDRPSSVTTTSYGSFQVHDLTNNRTAFAWNNHGASPNIGIGSSNCGTAHTDWTFCATTRTNWKLEIFINIPVAVTDYQLSFSSNEATSGSAPASIIGTGNKTLPTNSGNLGRTGFRFSGWNTAANGSGTRYATGATFNLTTNTTLYAQWSSNISYDPNTATSTRPIESTTAVGTAGNSTLSNGKLAPGSVVAPGLLFNMNAADSSSVVGTTWYEASRNSITGTIVGSPTYNAQEGYFQLNGTSQYINLGSTVMPATGSNTFTASVMFKSDQPSEDNDGIMSRYHHSNGGPFIIRNWSHGRIGAWRANTEPFSSDYNIGSINQATVSYNGTAWKLYLNGKIQATTTMGAASTAVSDLLLGAIGHQGSTVANYWAGRIYSAQGYSRALTDAEILANYQALLPGQNVTKENFTLLPWNTSSLGTGTSLGATATDLAALPSPYLRLQPSNYNAATKTWSSTAGSSSFTYRGTPQSIASNNGKFGATGNFPAIGGTVNDGLHLGNPTLTAYTLCVVARYRGLSTSPSIQASQGRLINAKSENWISGYYWGATAQFHHNSTNNLSGPTADLNWHYHCDSGNKAYWDGVKLTPWTNTTTTYLPSLSINGWDSGQYSDWELADLIIYDQFLPDSQIEQINRYFRNTYGISAGPQSTASATNLSPATTYSSSGDTTLYANWGSTITYEGNKQTSGTAPTTTIISGASGTLATNSGSLARAGFRFDGWNTNETGTGTTYLAGATYPNSGNITLYAKWTLKTIFPVATSVIEPNNLLPYMRYKASDYDATTKTWRDSSGNGRNTSLIEGTPGVVTTTANTNGSSKAIQVLQGVQADQIRFQNPTTTGGKYTLFSLVRYNSTLSVKQERILNSIDNSWFTGHHGDKAGVSYHENTWLKSVSTVTPITNWVLGTDYTSAYRSNGVQQTLEANGGANLKTLGINTYTAEASDFQVAEIILFDRTLTAAEIKQVEEYLAVTYGITAYSVTGTYSNSSSLAIGAGVGGRSETLTATNGLGTKTFTMSPSRSGITIETSTTNSVVLVVSPTTATGTYAQTITSTDATGETATHVINVTVNPSAKFDTSTATTLITTYRRAASLRLNTVFGVGNKVFTMTSAGTGISLDTTTAGSGYATLRVDTFTAVGTYTQLITVTDDTKIKSTYTITITINGPPTISSTSAISTTPVTSGLRLNLDAGDPESYSGSGTSWKDLSGNGRNATWQVTPTFSTNNGGTFTLNGSTQYATASSVRSEVFTVEAWVKFNSLNNDYACVVTNQYSSNKINYAICFWGDSKIRAGYHQSGTGWVGGTTGTFTPVVGTWYQFVYKVEKVGLNYIGSLFQNGNLVPGQTTSTIAPENDQLVDRIGVGWNSGVYINGSIPVVRIYNRALSTTEITQNYNALLPRFSNNPTNSVTITTTESVTAASSIYYAGLGTGTKTFTLSNATAGISIDTATVNTVRLNVANTVGATSTTVAKSISQVISAIDSNGVAAATPVYVTTIINPKVIIAASTPTTLTTTAGRVAYDTFTATYGTGNKTFTGTNASYPSAFVVTNPSTNVGLLTVGSNVPAGTYPVTITATDSVGGVTTYPLSVVVNPVPTIAGATGNTLSTTLTKAATLRINVIGGSGTRTLSWTSPNAGITLDSSTLASQNYITLRVETTTPTNTYAFSITATDSFSVRVAETFTVVVNSWPLIGPPAIVSNGLLVKLDGSTYSGSGSWNDSSGFGRNATLGGLLPTGTAPTFGKDWGGSFAFAAGTNQMQFPNPGNLETFTVSTWIRIPQATQTSNPAILGEYSGSTGDVNYMIQLFNGKIVGNYRIGSTWATEMTGFIPDINKWIYVTYTVEKTGTNSYLQSIYADGVFRDSKASTGKPDFNGTNGGVILLGRRWDTTASMTGNIAGVSIYGRALTAAEILQNFQADASRFLSTNSGRETVTVTQGVAGAITGVVASQGTGTKTFIQSGNNPGITISTPSTNTFTLNLADTLTATSPSLAKTLTETVTATDATGAATSYVYTVVISSPVKIESTTATIRTTSGVAAWDTFTATLGTGNKTFALTGTPNITGFTLTQANNQAVLKVGTTVNPGTYVLTITATDAVGATKSESKTVIVNSLPTITGNTSVAGTRGYTFNSPSYSASGGTGNLTFSLSTSPATPGSSTSGIKLSSTSGTPTIIVESTTVVDTYTVTLRVTDSLTAFSTFVVTIKVNAPVTLSGTLALSKVYGEDLSQVYTTGGGTAPFEIFASTICTTEKSSYTALGVTYTVEKFSGAGTCNWSAPTSVTNGSVLVLGGGGGGGSGIGGGGGAGEFYEVSSIALTPNTPVSVTVGSGGVSNSGSAGSPGNNSSFGSIVAYGGGGGGTNEVYGPTASQGANGELYGSGGGGGYPNTSWSGSTRLYGVQDNTNRGLVPTGTAARNNGATGSGGGGAAATAGGGGGAGGSGVAGTSDTEQGGRGGAGLSSSITGAATLYGGGGGGGVNGAGGPGQEPYRSKGREGAGGTGGGGAGGIGGGCADDANVCTGSITNPGFGSPGQPNTGGGGGGGSNTEFGGRGGSGTVIVRYVTPVADTETTRITLDTLSLNPVGSLRLNAPRNLPVGTYTQSVTVNDSAATPASTSATITITVSKATPTVTLSLPGSVTTAKYGNPVTISAIATTAGNIAFVNGTSNITACTAVATVAGLASCSWTPEVLGATTLKATLTPTDSTNYNNSPQATFAIEVIKADTLTVTATDETFNFTNNAALVTKKFTYSGLVSIDTLTAVSMNYSGTANDLTSYSNTVAPSKAGTYLITPDTSTAGISTIASNYVKVEVVPGTLTINRILGPVYFSYNSSSNSVTYAPNATYTPNRIDRAGNGLRTFTTTSPSVCSIDSATAVVTAITAGNCYLVEDLAQDPNYLAYTKLRTLVINKASRTFTLTPAVSTLKYSETTTVTATLSGGESDGDITYTLGSPAGCTFDPLSGEITAISGTLQCPLSATISEGINYLAETATAISLTIARADAPIITLDTVTAMDYTPNIRALVMPSFTVSGLKNSETVDSLTFTYSFVSNPFESFTYSDTRTPFDAGTYRITPSALTLSSGLMSNYETPTYTSSAIDFIINRIAQESTTIVTTNGEVDVPFTLQAIGGSTNGAVSYTKLSGTSCSVAGNSLSATASGLCVLAVTRAGNRNYLPYTSESITVMVRNYVIFQFVAPTNPTTGIAIVPTTPTEKGSNSCTTGCVPKIISTDIEEGAEAELVVITGLSFNGVTKVFFNIYTEAPNFTVDSDTQISVRVPADLPVGDATIEVKSPGGTSNRYFNFYILP